METFSGNPFWVTVMGMAVVICSLVVLMLLTLATSAVVRWVEGLQERKTKPTAAPLSTEMPESTPLVGASAPLGNTASPGSELSDEELVVVLTAAAFVALGVPVRVLEFAPQEDVRASQAWTQVGRLQNMAQPTRM